MYFTNADTRAIFAEACPFEDFSQLMTDVASNKKIYNSLCNPQIIDGWNNLNESLETLSSFSSRTCKNNMC